MFAKLYSILSSLLPILPKPAPPQLDYWLRKANTNSFFFMYLAHQVWISMCVKIWLILFDHLIHSDRPKYANYAWNLPWFGVKVRNGVAVEIEKV